MANENEGLINYSLKGFVNIDKQTIECFLGDKDDNKSSEEVTKFLKEKELKYSGWDYQIVGKNYRFFFPLIEKSITIAIKEGITYYSKIFNIYDIKSIICDLQFKNPFYIDENGKNHPFEYESDLIIFLADDRLKYIKDIQQISIDYNEIKNIFNNNSKKNSIFALNLQEINDNILNYTKQNIYQEKYYPTKGREIQKGKLESFFYNKKRKDINDIIYGIVGNYAGEKVYF